MKVNLDELVKDHIIDEDVASRIQTYYTNRSTSTSAAHLIRTVSIIGVTLIGLGMMLIIAYNWDSMAKPLRLLIALLPLGIAQVMGFYSIWKSKDSTWKESSSLSILFGVGIAMALITQIYQMDGSLQDFLKWWIILSIPLIYFFESGATSLAVWIGIGWFILSGSWNKEAYRLIYPLAFIIAASIPYYFKGFYTRTTVFSVHPWSWHHWVVPIVSIIFLFSCNPFMCVRLSPVYFSILALLFLVAGRHSIFLDRTLLNGYHLIAFVGTWVIAFIVSFGFYWSPSENESLIHCLAEAHWLLPMVASVVLAVLLFYFYKHPFENGMLKSLYYLILSLIAVLVIGNALGTFSQWVINLIVLGASAWMIYHGIQTEKLLILNLGLFALAIWILCRFFETDISFAWRGVIFIALGILCFSLNYILLQRKKT